MEAAHGTYTYDVTEADFETRVIERSRSLPVVVDFWAEWCAPCRALGPVLEQAVAALAGKVELAKLDTDVSPAISARFDVRGIPAVKAFRDGTVVSEFTGALPAPQVEAFLDALLPSEAAELAAQAVGQGDEDGLRRALEVDPDQPEPAVALARLLLRRGETDEAAALVKPFAATDFEAAGLVARAGLESEPDAPREAFEAWDAGDQAAGFERLQDAVAASTDPARRDALRAVMVGLFTELGTDHPLVREHRRRLAAMLS